MKIKVSMTLDELSRVMAGVQSLAEKRVLVGIPAEKAERDDVGDSPINNAAIGYIQENGDPEMGLPPRPFLVPGVRKAQNETVKILRNTAAMALDKGPAIVEKGLNAAGQVAASSSQMLITEGIAPALAESTLRNRARLGMKGAIAELKHRASGGTPTVTGNVTPLIVSGQLRRAITWVLRKRNGKN